jgi:hypothetical protein
VCRWMWTNETDCPNLGELWDFRFNQSWAASDRVDEPPSIFFEPTSCTPVSEVEIGEMPPSGITDFDVHKLKPDPSAFAVPSFCPRSKSDDSTQRACPPAVKARRVCPANLRVQPKSDVGPDGTNCPSSYNASGVVPECVYDVCHFQLDAGAGAKECGAGCCAMDNCSKFVVSPVLHTPSITVCPGKSPCGPGHDCCWLKGGASTFISGPYISGSVYTDGGTPPACPPGEVSISGPKFIERPVGATNRRHGIYKAQVLDLDGNELPDPHNITWSVAGAASVAGISVSNGDLTVDGSVAADSVVNVTASVGGLAAVIKVTVAVRIIHVHQSSKIKY